MMSTWLRNNDGRRRSRQHHHRGPAVYDDKPPKIMLSQSPLIVTSQNLLVTPSSLLRVKSPLNCNYTFSTTLVREQFCVGKCWLAAPSLEGRTPIANAAVPMINHRTHLHRRQSSRISATTANRTGLFTVPHVHFPQTVFRALPRAACTTFVSL